MAAAVAAVPAASEEPPSGEPASAPDPEGRNAKPAQNLNVEAKPDADTGEYEEVEAEEEGDEKSRAQSIFRRLSSEAVPIRVHDIVIKGNSRTRDAVIESEVDAILREAKTVQDLIRAATFASAKLRNLDIFDSVAITLDAGPPELPGTTNVVIEVVEAANPLTGNAGVFSRPEARSWALEGSVKWRNLMGYGDIWDASGSYGWDQTTEISVGTSLPRFRAISTPVTARLSLLSQDWLKYSSYKERLLGLSVGILSTMHHDLSYNLTWRNLTDPSRMASRCVRRQLGHHLLSALKYTYKIDQRDSHLRPTRGYAFVSTSQVGGLWNHIADRFFRQELDVRGALSLGYLNAALNVGIGAGVVVPWGRGFKDMSTLITDRFFLGGQSSLVSSFSAASTLLGFRMRGLGPSEPRRYVPSKSGSDDQPDPGRDFVGGDFAVSTFADLSFDIPIKVLRDAGIHGHAFACAGNLLLLSELKNFNPTNILQTSRSSVGAGVVLPTKFFRVEINYVHVLKQSEHDRAKSGFQFSLSSPM